jgi:hypothetical protein
LIFVKTVAFWYAEMALGIITILRLWGRWLRLLRCKLFTLRSRQMRSRNKRDCRIFNDRRQMTCACQLLMLFFCWMLHLIIEVIFDFMRVNANSELRAWLRQTFIEIYFILDNLERAFLFIFYVIYCLPVCNGCLFRYLSD